MMATTIKNKRVIITGGANGLGKGFASRLLLKGAKMVAILDIDIESGRDTAKNFDCQFGRNRCVFLPTDVSKSEQFEESFKKAIDHLGGLDIMINNAGIFDASRWSSMVDINLKGVIQGTLMAVDAMGKHKGGEGGTIINIASITGVMACQYIPIYSATKHAVIGFSRGIAMSFERTGVSIKTICPTATDTSIMALNPHQYLELVDRQEAIKWSQDWPLQKLDVVVDEVDRLIEQAPNGAIWVNRLDESTLSMNIPEFTEWGTPV